MARVAEPDVGAGRWVRRSGRELEGRRSPCRPPESEDELLDPQVAGVARLLVRIASEADDQGPIERQPDPLPSVHRQAAPEPSLGQPDRVVG